MVCSGPVARVPPPKLLRRDQPLARAVPGVRLHRRGRPVDRGAVPRLHGRHPPLPQRHPPARAEERHQARRQGGVPRVQGLHLPPRPPAHLSVRRSARVFQMLFSLRVSYL